MTNNTSNPDLCWIRSQVVRRQQQHGEEEQGRGSSSVGRRVRAGAALWEEGQDRGITGVGRRCRAEAALPCVGGVGSGRSGARHGPEAQSVRGQETPRKAREPTVGPRRGWATNVHRCWKHPVFAQQAQCISYSLCPIK